MILTINTKNKTEKRKTATNINYQLLAQPNKAAPANNCFMAMNETKKGGLFNENNLTEADWLAWLTDQIVLFFPIFPSKLRLLFQFST